MMKKLTFVLALLVVASTAFAEIKALQGYGDTATFYQFTHDEATNTGNYHDGRNAGQNWLGAQTIQLFIDTESDLWVSNYVDSWYSDILALDGNVYQMGDKQYGAFEIYGDKVWEGNGVSKLVTYKDNVSGLENTTEAYYVGHFKGGETVALYMTTLATDGGETVDSWQYVNDADHPTTLYSRVDGTHDQAGNVRLNYGLTTYPDGREFVVFGVSDNPMPSGQPLPGVFSTIAVACCSIACIRNRKAKKGKNK